MPCSASGSTLREPSEVSRQLHQREGIQSGADVVEHDSRAFRQVFEPAQRERLSDVEDSKQYKCGQHRLPIERSTDERNQLAGNFVDDHDGGIALSQSARDARGGGNTDEDDSYRADDSRDEAMARRGVTRESEPEQHG